MDVEDARGYAARRRRSSPTSVIRCSSEMPILPVSGATAASSGSWRCWGDSGSRDSWRSTRTSRS